MKVKYPLSFEFLPVLMLTTDYNGGDAAAYGGGPIAGTVNVTGFQTTLASPPDQNYVWWLALGSNI